MIQIDNLNTNSAQELLNNPIPNRVLDSFNTVYNIEESIFRSYEENGYVKLEKVLEGEALTFANKTISSSVFLRKIKDKRTLEEKSEYEKSFLQCGYLCWDYQAVKIYVLAKRFAGIARNLMQVKHVRLWHDQALYKEQGGNPTAVHQDCSYWPIAKPDNTITMWMALEDVTAEMGSLYFYPGTHNVNIKEYVDIFSNPHIPNSLENIESFPVSLKVVMQHFIQDYFFMEQETIRQIYYEKGMTIIYIGDGNIFDASDERNAIHTSCEGLKHGEVIDTKYTPIII